MAFAATQKKKNTPGNAEELGQTLAGRETEKWQAVCMEMTTHMRSVMGSHEFAEYVSRAPPNEAHQVFASLVEKMGYRAN
jgi:hypothetical protein